MITLPVYKAFATDVASLATATRRNSPTETIYVPMVTSRTFSTFKVRVVVHVDAVADLTNPLIGLKLGSASFSDVTLNNPFANSGENLTHIFEQDFTSYANTNFGSGASQTVQVGFQCTLGSGTVSNISIEIFGSVSFDETTDNTQTNLIEMVCDSPLGALTATLTEVGTNQIPILDNLPEASKTFRQILVIIEGNDITDGTANDAQFGFQLDSNSEVQMAAVKSSNSSNCYYRYIFDITGLDTSVVHAIKLRSSTITTASTFNHPAIKIVVYYEFSWSGSSTIAHTLRLPIESLNTLATSSNVLFSFIKFPILEPASITLLQSGAIISYAQTGNINPRFIIGTQTERTYTDPTGVFCSRSYVSQRMDSGGAGGAGISLVRGDNILSLASYLSAASSANGVNGWYYLTYTSGKSSLGRSAHARTLPTHIFNSIVSTGGVLTATTNLFSFTETDYYVVAADFEVSGVSGGSIAASTTCSVVPAVGELAGNIGLLTQSIVFESVDSESWTYRYTFPINLCHWIRWSNDPETTRMALKSSRKLAIIIRGNSNIYGSCTSYITIRGKLGDVSGNITNTDGQALSIRVMSTTSKEVLAITSRTGDGSYSVPCFEDTTNVYVTCHGADSSHLDLTSVGGT